MAINRRRNHKTGGLAVIAGNRSVAVIVRGIGIDHDGIAVFPAGIAVAARPTACHVARAARRVVAPAAAATAKADVKPVLVCVSRALGDQHAVLVVVGNANGTVFGVKNFVFQGDGFLDNQLGAAL